MHSKSIQCEKPAADRSPKLPNWVSNHVVLLLTLFSILPTTSFAGLRDSGGSGATARAAGWNLRDRLIATNMQVQSVVYSKARGKAIVFAGGEGLGFLGKNFVEILVCDFISGPHSPRKNDMNSCVPLKVYENTEAKNGCISNHISRLAEERGDQADALLKQLSAISATIATAGLASCAVKPPAGGTIARAGRFAGLVGIAAALGTIAFLEMRKTDQFSQGPQTYRSVESLIAAMPTEGNPNFARATSKDDLFNSSKFVFDRFQDLLLQSIDLCQKRSGSQFSSK